MFVISHIIFLVISLVDRCMKSEQITCGDNLYDTFSLWFYSTEIQDLKVVFLVCMCSDSSLSQIIDLFQILFYPLTFYLLLKY